MLSLEDLDALRLFLHELKSRQVVSLAQFFDEKTGLFQHRYDRPRPGHFSPSSAATCILSLVANGNWHSQTWGKRTEDLFATISGSRWITTGLPINNVYSTMSIPCPLSWKPSTPWILDQAPPTHEMHSKAPPYSRL